jgi:AcrR family transcriptional regulator
VTSASPARRGRRPGSADAGRAAILKAAAKEFALHGYDGASIRGIARRAEVDPALVHHYFDGKAALFAESVKAPVRPDKLVAEALDGPRELIGERLVRILLTSLEHEPARTRVIQLVRTALGHDFAARMLREFILREILQRVADALEVADAELRATLAGSQLVGLMVVRFGIRAEPLASEPIEEVVARVGPVLTWHLIGYPDRPLTAEVAAANNSSRGE